MMCKNRNKIRSAFSQTNRSFPVPTWSCAASSESPEKHGVLGQLEENPSKPIFTKGLRCLSLEMSLMRCSGYFDHEKTLGTGCYFSIPRAAALWHRTKSLGCTGRVPKAPSGT